jgi:hypothetical protein
VSGHPVTGDDLDDLAAHLQSAAEFHVTMIGEWWVRLPVSARKAIADYLVQILSSVERLHKLLPPDLDPLEVVPAGTQLYGIIKGYPTGGKAAVINAIKSLLPDLAPIAATLENL